MQRRQTSPQWQTSPCGRGKLAMYFTSSRVVRKTIEDCSKARIIVQGYRFLTNDRDVSIQKGFKDELQGLSAKD
ncbi:hypothetical protein KSP39_PZI023406 [Platanthera zijinensis]|uniref:Uncharacterized protein n=1 Tax=Platanthera zijinensis TaxID=2320716 RepID=A0AAP0AT06_9ASPA